MQNPSSFYPQNPFFSVVTLNFHFNNFCAWLVKKLRILTQFVQSIYLFENRSGVYPICMKKKEVVQANLSSIKKLVGKVPTANNC